MTPTHHMQCSAPAELREEIVRWTAGLGAVTAEALALRLRVSVGSARARLLAAERRGLLARHRPLVGRPSLYTVTRHGLRAVGARGLEPARVSAAGASHLIECAHVAVALERRYPDHRVSGERELRREERERGRALASAEIGAGPRTGFSRHRPDLVLWPRDPRAGAPIAVEVELTVKSPARLLDICRGWARARCVCGVVYLVAPDVERALLSAVERARADERIAVIPLDRLPRERPVPSGA
jgi:hypothetical protein